jgi:hypothetical protein
MSARRLTMGLVPSLCVLVGVYVFAGVPALAAGDATNASCPSATEAGPGFRASLPDCRAYELVTPVEKNGAFIGGIFVNAVPPQISGNGQHVVAVSDQCFANSESCTALRGKSEGEPYEFERRPGGWVTKPLAPPSASYEDSGWLSLHAGEAGAAALFLAPSAPQSLTDLFLARTEDGSLRTVGPVGDRNAPAPPGAEGEPPNFNLVEGLTVATTDLSHVIYTTEANVWSFDTEASEPEIPQLYEYVKGRAQPLIVGVQGGVASTSLLSTCGTRFGNGEVGLRNKYGSLSEDGRVVYLTVEGKGHRPGSECTGPETNVLYARVDGEDGENGSGEATEARSAPISVEPPAESCSTMECREHATTPADMRDARFEGASANGSRTFFTDTQQLTDSATESAGSAIEGCNSNSEPGGCNLYEWECPHCDELTTAAQETSLRKLIDVSAGQNGAEVPGGPRVQGVVGMSADGSHVYFVAKGVLTAGEANHNGEEAESEADNLYAYERTGEDAPASAGHVVFVGRLAEADLQEWLPNRLSAETTPDGSYLVFTSHRALTPDESRSEGPAQVYEYSAQSRTLTRVSIGEAGFNANGNDGEGSAHLSVPYFGHGGWGVVPVRADPGLGIRDGVVTVFFQSPVALTPGALDDIRVGGSGPIGEGFAQNIYEYREGHVYLLSDGKDTTGEFGGQLASHTPVELVGSDLEGKNVFFATFDPLVPEDTDTQRDIYDARVCSEAEPCSPPAAEPPPPCGDGACQGTPPSPAPDTSTPGSATFSGTGNLAAPPPVVSVQPNPLSKAQKLARALKTCRARRDKPKRRACEAQARKHYAPPHGKAKKSDHKPFDSAPKEGK